jgi:RNA polymerase sigma factor (sigma-70 family)
MTTTQAGVVLQHIHRLASQPASTADDLALLERYRVGRDELAFTELMRRHGPMVLGVCRRVLGNPHDADDAFQATFLTLASKSASINRSGSVGGWLYQVAFNTALKSKEKVASRQRREQRASSRTPADPLDEVTGRELLAMLDEEMASLPSRQREPLVLCYLEGRTRDEAARALGWSLGTLKRRLEEGRERLHQRLARRGIALPAALLATGVFAPIVPAALTASVLGTAGGKVAPPVAFVSAGVWRVVRSRFKVVVAALLMAGLVAGIGLLAGRPPAAAPQKKGSAAPVVEDRKEMAVTGRVVDAASKPVSGARVGLAAGPYAHRDGWAQMGPPVLLGQTTSDKDGRFRLTAPATSSARHYLVKLYATAGGHGLGQEMLDVNLAEHDVLLRLPKEQSIRGRLMDLQGAGVAGAVVRVHKVWGQGRKNLVGWFSQPVVGLQAWPEAVTTDSDGRFQVRGLSSDLTVTLRVADDRFAVQNREVDTRADGRPAETTWPLAPAHILEGTVLCADTRKPMPQARVEVMSLVAGEGGTDAPPRGRGTVECRCDDRGRFQVNTIAGTRYSVRAVAPAGQPYLAAAQEVGPAKGTTRQKVDLLLPRGRLVRGIVKEAPSGKPVAGAAVQFQPRTAYYSDLFWGWNDETRTGPDGRFALAVPSLTGTVLVKGPTPDFVHVEVSDGKFLSMKKPIGLRHYPDGLADIDLKPDAAVPEVQITLRRGTTVRGQILDPDGQPVKWALMYCPSYIPVGYRYSGQPVMVRDGRFEVPGVDPAGKLRLYFFGNKELGATVEMSAKEAIRAPLKVTLRPCGKAKVRFIGVDGKPIPKSVPVQLELVVTPGGLPPTPFGAIALKDLTADLARVGHHVQWTEEEDGAWTLGRLIPGATYRFRVSMDELGLAGSKPQDFVVEAGKTRQLPDVKVWWLGGR